MFTDAVLLTAVLAPTAGAFLLPVLGKFPRLRNALAVALVCVALACSLAMVPVVAAGKTIAAGHWPQLGVPSALVADGLAVFMACVASLVSTIVVIYSLDYVRKYPHQNEYYLMVVLFLGAMMGLVFSANLLLLYVFWEITAIASWRLIGFFRGEGHARRADKAFLITAFGAAAMLAGFVSIYAQTGSLDLVTVRNTVLPSQTVALILAGVLSKSATLPFHTWLPDAGVAPSPVTALLHAAVLVKIGVYVFARLFVVTFPLPESWHTMVMVTAGASALVASGAALVDNDLKRILAYSTVSQIGFIFLGLASGTQIGVAGALLFILTHGLAKGGLFLCAGIVEQNTHTKDITHLGGLMRTMPVTAAAFLLCASSVMGVPPLGGFFGKYMVISGAIQGDHLWIALTFIVGAFLTVLYILRMFGAVFLGEGKAAPVREASPVMVASVAVLAALTLASGVLVAPSAQLARMVAEHMQGIAR